MASKRMFSLSVVNNDNFMDLPLSAQALYFQFSMRADDDGFVTNKNALRRAIGASEEDLTTLIKADLLIIFDTGTAVIRHWKVNNKIQKDKYKASTCAEKDMLLLKDDVYYLNDGTEKISESYQKDTETAPKGSQFLPSGIGIGLGIGLDIDNPPIVPLAGGRKEKIIIAEALDRLKFSSPVKGAITKWFSGRKAPQKERFNSFIEHTQRSLIKHGESAYITMIEISLAGNYKGPAWDWFDRQHKTSAVSLSDPDVPSQFAECVNWGTGAPRERADYGT